MKAKERRERAQDYLMDALGVAFYKIADNLDLDEEEKAELTEEASRQMERIERLFGFKPGSWGRG